ncbi:MAG: lipoprotein-releasing system transmembrane subunit, LolC/LolE family, partial [Halieaceae bacterium]|nr:lipoprotein-releasing system transmembrane subunit, LolC/LolE family [Halieaceae bacterium]
MSARGHAITNYAAFIGLRYSFSRKRNRFTSVIALVSMLGMVLGVTSLITVLSVMNGFGGELRGRILSLVPHGFVESPSGGISEWQPLAKKIESMESVLAVSPYISDKVIFANGRTLRGGVLTAIDPAMEARVSRIPEAMISGSLDSLAQPGFSVVLGASMARILRVRVGDKLEVTVPRL